MQDRLRMEGPRIGAQSAPSGAEQELKPIKFIPVSEFLNWFEAQDLFVKNWLNATGFKAEVGAARSIPTENGNVHFILFCVAYDNLMSVGSLPFTLPEGSYSIDNEVTKYFTNEQLALINLYWGLGAYQFTHFKKAKREAARLIVNEDRANQEIQHIINATYLVRELINLPADDLGPTQFAEFIKGFAGKFKINYQEIVGEDLKAQGFGGIYTVGKGSDEAPRLIDLHWGNKNHPKVTLVGKGVCFDTGGLDIKPAQYMMLMKKDMAGAAHVLGLAQLLVETKLPINLRILLPIVENAVGSRAYHPGDVIKSKKGLTIEVGNTDAEGRVILADALYEACQDQPELIIDMSTLTGAARVAVGTEISAFFTNEDAISDEIMKAGKTWEDPMWSLPLYAPYRESLKSSIADLNNCPSDSFGGAINAALFLQEFVDEKIAWVHIDTMAWNLKTKPARPMGGEAMSLRAIYGFLKERYK